jgi:hypothetical protein
MSTVCNIGVAFLASRDSAKAARKPFSMHPIQIIEKDSSQATLAINNPGAQISKMDTRVP